MPCRAVHKSRLDTCSAHVCHRGRVFRLLGLLGGLSVATDLGTGAPMEESLKRCLVAARFARELGVGEDEVRAVVYTSLLQHLGCTAFSHEAAEIFGDDIAMTRFAFLTDWEDRTDLLRTWVPGVARATGRSRLRVLATTLASSGTLDAVGPAATCEVARDAARRLGLPEDVRAGVHAALTLWNGHGTPAISGTSIPLCTRIAHVSGVAVMFTLHAGPAAARSQLTKRSGTHLDPDLVGAFDIALVDDIDVVDAYDAVQEAEPDPVQLVDDARLAEVARTFGDLADLKSPSLHGHSSSVGELAHAAAQRLRLEESSSVGVAGYLHDLGRVAVSSAVWDKQGSLTTSERDQVELHPYYTERILARVPALAEVAALAGRHHEHCDGSGYHRGLGAASLTMSARVLAAADRYRNLVEARPHRAAQSAATAATTLRGDARAGRLDGDAVEAVLAAAGHSTGVRRPRVADLTDRQVDVLRLLATGLSNREIAERLVISPRTAERHVQDLYSKIGLSTRAGAALYAMEHGLLGGAG